MRYWGYLVGKLAMVGVFLLGLRMLIDLVSRPEPMQFVIHKTPEPIRYVMDEPFGHHLGYTILFMVFALVAAGLVWLVIWDQRYRCRTCARRLMMPIATGSWTHVLFSRPRTEYICPFGHGTLKVEELQITGHSGADWQPHEDIWKELLSLEETKK
jgi:hypothetical protein